MMEERRETKRVGGARTREMDRKTSTTRAALGQRGFARVDSLVQNSKVRATQLEALRGYLGAMRALLNSHVHKLAGQHLFAAVVGSSLWTPYGVQACTSSCNILPRPTSPLGSDMYTGQLGHGFG
jgi:hypothetical protein